MENNSKTNTIENRKCNNCGTQLEANDKFCKICGARLDEPSTSISNTYSPQPQTNPTVPYYTKPDMPQINSKPKKKSKLPLFIAIGIFAIIVLTAILSNICFHNWSEETCTAPAICEECSKTKGEPLGHNWSDATCTTPKTCQRCNLTDGEALGHTISDWKTTAESTCSKQGEQEGVCKKCSETITEALPLKEHTEGKWTVTKKATVTDAGEKTLKCTVCDEIIETQEYKLSEKEIKSEYIKQCKTYSYDEIARNPGKYDGKYAKFTGEIIQVQQQELFSIMMYVLRVNVNYNGYYYEDTLYVTYYADEDDSRLLEEDIVTMYGKLTGEKTYETVLGNSITIPSFSAEYIDTK